jgi:hypothetical protein
MDRIAILLYILATVLSRFSEFKVHRSSPAAGAAMEDKQLMICCELEFAS